MKSNVEKSLEAIAKSQKEIISRLNSINGFVKTLTVINRKLDDITKQNKTDEKEQEQCQNTEVD